MSQKTFSPPTQTLLQKMVSEDMKNSAMLEKGLAPENYEVFMSFV